MKNGTSQGQPAAGTAEEVKGSTRREHSSTKPDFHGSSVNAKITRPPFGVKKLTILQEAKKQGGVRQFQFLPEQ